MNFETVKNRFDEVKSSKEVRTVNPKIQGVIIGLLDKACGSKENRYQFAIALGMAPHSKDWSVGEWYAVSQIVKADKPADKWIASNPNFDSIIGAVMAEIGKNDLQMEMEMSGQEAEQRGKVQVTRDMAIDAGDRSLEGQWIEW
jgi:hypothetical protein